MRILCLCWCCDEILLDFVVQTPGGCGLTPPTGGDIIKEIVDLCDDCRDYLHGAPGQISSHRYWLH